MKKRYLVSVSSIIFLLSISCFADPGDVIVNNENQAVLGSADPIQFQFITNGGGLITSAVLSSLPLGNTQTLGEDSFSDQTNQFSIYIRDATAVQNPYIQCSAAIPYQHNNPLPLKIRGWSDGKKANCQVETVSSNSSR